MRDGDDGDRIGMRQWLYACTAFKEKANPFGAADVADRSQRRTDAYRVILSPINSIT